MRSPFPWTMLLARVVTSPKAMSEARADRLAGETDYGGCARDERSPGRRKQLRPRGADPLGRPRVDRAGHVRVLLRLLARPQRRRLREHLAAVVGAVRHRHGALPADRAAALAHDRRAAGARDRARPADAGAAAAAGRLRGRVPRSSRCCCARSSATSCWGSRRRCTGSSLFAVLAYAASYFARGWLAGHQWFTLYGGLVFLESASRLMFALAVAVGIAEGQTAVALGMAAAPLFSLVVVPLAFRRRKPPDPASSPPSDELGLARGGRFALRRAADHARRADAGERRGADDEDHRPGRRGRRLRVQRAADRPGAADALPGDPGLAPPPPRRARGRRGPRGGRPRGADHAARHRRLRGRGGARAARCSAPGRWTSCSTTGRPTVAGA